MVANITGYAELINGSMGTAAYMSLDYAFSGWFGIMIFFVIQLMVLLRTRNYPITVVIGLVMYSLFVTSTYVTGAGLAVNLFNSVQSSTMVVVMVIETAGAIYYLAAK